MLSRNLKRALLDSRWPLPPTFLLPWAAGLSTSSQSTITSTSLPPIIDTPGAPQDKSISASKARIVNRHISDTSLSDAIASLVPRQNAEATPLALSDSVRSMLPLLQSQAPHYITVHIHGKHYLLTQGDTVRLPFLMHGVEPGDVLRLNRAINLGSRDYTLKAAAAGPQQKSPAMDTTNILDRETGAWSPQTQALPTVREGFPEHFIPHIAKGKHSYVDERLFVCRAVVMGVDSEPLRIKEKTKRRQRKVKTVKSKHKFTILKIKELRVRDLAEVENSSELD